jgi:hypothetical protein
LFELAAEIGIVLDAPVEARRALERAQSKFNLPLERVVKALELEGISPHSLGRGREDVTERGVSFVIDSEAPIIINLFLPIANRPRPCDIGEFSRVGKSLHSFYDAFHGDIAEDAFLEFDID